MSLKNDFTCDTEFVKLLTRRNDVDLTIAALELARDAYPDLDFQETVSWIEEKSREFSGRITRQKNELGMLQELGRFLAEEQGIYGDHNCYQRAECSFLNRVIETGRGIPISLSVLYMAVGERLGIVLRGISAPAHFLVRYESIEGPLFVDPFSRGRILTPRQCKNWLRTLTGLSDQSIKSALKPVEPRAVIIRMLNNLKKLYCVQENWSAAWVIQHRLTLLQPASFLQRKDLAYISLRANRPGQAIDMLHSCLQSCPNEDREHLEVLLNRAREQLTLWN